MRTLSAIATVLLVSATGPAAYAQDHTATNDGSSNDTGTTTRLDMRAPKRALELGVNGGYTQPVGELGDDLSIHGVVIAGGAVGLALGYRFDPHWSLEGTSQFQQLMAGPGVEGTYTTLRGLTTGVQGTYHFRPYRMIDPYASLGTGYRMLWLVPTGTPNSMVHGFELAKVTLGVDVRMTPSFALGPMLGADVNVFVWNNADGAASNVQLKALRPSTFLFAGIGGRFDAGGYRVTRQPVVAQQLAPAPAPAAVVSRPAAARSERPMTFTAISIERRILETCKIEGPKAYFDFDKANLKDTDQSTLDLVATCFTTGPLKGSAMKVVGHTDPRGSDEYNQKLGQSRAESVSDYLSGKGVPAPEMSTESRGEQDAVGSDELGWAYDRRVDIRLGN